jgi:DNA invertase Pin-like site-specific DNA recombinase
LRPSEGKVDQHLSRVLSLGLAGPLHRLFCILAELLGFCHGAKTGASSALPSNGITFDGATKDAMQRAVRDALIAFMAATAQAQAEATK